MKKEEIINALIKIFKAGISFEYIGDFYRNSHLKTPKSSV